jgi:hypothetical protein
VILFSLIRSRSPGRDDPTSAVADRVDHSYLHIIEAADRDKADLAVSIRSIPQVRPGKDSGRVLEIDAMRFEIPLPLRLIPLERFEHLFLGSAVNALVGNVRSANRLSTRRNGRACNKYNCIYERLIDVNRQE